MTSFANNRPRRWRRDDTPITTKREGDLADLLARTLRGFAMTVRLHDDCESCGTDLAIFERQARELGIDPAAGKGRP